MKLAELQEMWKEDSNIDVANLGVEAANTPKLHAKYLALLTSVKLQLRKSEGEFIRLKKLKFRWYRGEMSKEELVVLGWDQYLQNKPLKNEIDDYILSDDDVITVVDKIEYIKTTLYQLEQILKSINSRTWDVKSAIEWYKFTNGGF